MYPVRTEGPKRNQKVLAPSYGLRCAQVPSLRSCSVGTPPRAIHGPSRLSWHPCRSTHCAEPPLGLPGGLADQKHCAPRRPTGRPVWRKCVLHNLCSRCRGTKAAFGVMRHSEEVVAKSGNALCQLNLVLRVCDCCVAVAHPLDRSLRSSAAATGFVQGSMLAFAVATGLPR